ncbi:MAG: SNF2-related protein, partial [Verrucomicrobiota bacterium]
GQVCAHSVAVALQVINGEPSPLQKPETVSKTASLPKKESKPRGVGLLPIFDQRLVSMWERGRIPVKLEIGPIEPPGAWDWLESVGVTTLPVHAVLNPEQASQFLTLTAESPAKLGEEDFLISGTSAARLKVELRQKDDEFEVIPSKWMSQDQVRLKDWVFIPKFRAIQPLRKPPKGGEKAYENLLQGKTVRLSAGELLANVDGWHDCLEFRSEVGQGLVVRPGNPSFQLKVEGSMNALSGVATVIYADNLNFRLGKSPQSNAFPFRSEDGAFVVRNALGEHQAQQALTEDLGFSGPDKDGQFQMRGEADISRFYASGVAKLGKKWEVELGERFQHVTRNLEVIRPRFVSQGTENNWLSFAIDYSSPDGSEIPREEIQKLLNKSQNRVQLANGRSAVVDLEACAEADEVIYDVQANQEGGGQFRVQSSQSGYLTAALGAEDLTDTTAVNLDELGELNEVLRDYQRDGIEWILQRFRGGAKACLLADEMGLGKTLQSFAALQMLKNSEEGQVLIVCPTSLLSNWQLEAAKFIPLLKTEILHGPKRWDNPKKLEGTDILITSYALLVRDAEKYAERPFLLTVLDEASAIKNPDTKNAKACRAIDSKHRIALTGTPVENTVRELWSIFQYLIPGYLGSRDEFKERYESPIAGGAASKQVLERLRNRIKPLTLRRLKQTVAKDLPPKIEQVRFCQLSPAQAQLYEAILRESRKKIDDALSQKSEGQARMTMLTALLRLRQVCCEPRLLALDEETKATSAKLELFSELVTEAIEGEHKMLVFSQFTAMLKILREQLEDKDIPYNYLDGSSTDRTEQVQQFQKSRERQVFLISLKAGGYGLNLTAADTVIHYDPWWNPAVEAQATDRAHRIGQTNPVSAYKLITTGTVEERILALQRRKKAVIDAALDDGEPLMRGLATEEIREVIG